MDIIGIFSSESISIEILDVGASLYETPPYQSLVDAGIARVTGFEPNKDECKRLNETYSTTHKFFPHFVGDGKTATFHETNWNITGSLLEPNTELLEKFQNLGEVVRPVAQHKVNTVCLDEIVDLPNIDFIKIDIQGGELAVFQNAKRVLANVLSIHTEVEFVELYKNQPLFADVDIFLRSQGFQFHTFTGFGSRAFKPIVLGGDLNRGFRQYLWSDAVYFRDWLKLSQLTNTQLKKMAIIAHEIYHSCDLAYIALQKLDEVSGSDYASRYLPQTNT